MCGRFVLTTPVGALADLFGFANPLPNLPPRYNIAPTQVVAIVRLDHQGARELALVRWGLVPSWSKTVPDAALINARGETVAEKASFRGAFRHRRCLVPADGFYEWQKQAVGKPRPVYIRRPDAAPFAFAGIWDSWLGADGSEIDSVALVTTTANETLTPVHPRMPVVLAMEDWTTWMTGDRAQALALIKPAPDADFAFHTVSTAVNKVAQDDASLVKEAVEEPAEENLPREGQLSLF